MGSTLLALNAAIATVSLYILGILEPGWLGFSSLKPGPVGKPDLQIVLFAGLGSATFFGRASSS